MLSTPRGPPARRWTSCSGVLLQGQGPDNWSASLDKRPSPEPRRGCKPRGRLRRRRDPLEAEREPAVDDPTKDTQSGGAETPALSSTDPLAKTVGASSDDDLSGPHEAPPGKTGPTIVYDDDDADEGPDPMIGRVLSGLYKVDSRIGEGGMGTVYMAVHIHLDKPFAVKVLSDKVAANKSAIDRLKQEARAASSIDHDNIVDVVSFDATDDGRVFLVMEMLEGKSLADVIEPGPMALSRALPIAHQMCEALQAAHDGGIVHRDLKPENVFICRKRDSDFVKILDFGISKVKTAEAEQVRMTRTGQLVGTPLYMSPEQARGEADVDHRADIYALGVMLYEMLTARPPFEGGNYFQLLWKHGNEEPKPPSEYVSMPAAVEAAILKALAKDPADRPQSMAALSAALSAAAPDIDADPGRLMSVPPSARASLPEPAAVATPEPVAGPSRLPWIGLAGAVLLLLVGLGLSQMGDDAVEPTTRLETGPETEPPTKVQPTEMPTEMQAAPTTDRLPEGALTPVPQVVRFVSDPPGATVLRGDERLGVTPLELSFPEGESLEVTYRLRGYRAAGFEGVAAEGAVIEGRLQRRAGVGSAPMSMTEHRTML